VDSLNHSVVDLHDHSDNELAVRPRRIEDTGLTTTFLAELTGKHLLTAGTLSLNDLIGRLALPGRLLEDVLHFMRQESRIQILGAEPSGTVVRYALTDAGRAQATQALSISGYVGPAPVPLSDYVQIIRAQSIHQHSVTTDSVRTALHDAVLNDSLLDSLGPSLNSGRAIFIYGPAGTGKTYVAQRLARVFGSTVLIPHSILVNDTVIAIFDPVMHRAVTPAVSDSLRVDSSIDARYVECARPAVAVGGELTEDMLNIQFDAATREYRAPLQLKANNGVFVIDDMGRQRAEAQAVFNRWIVPLEEQRDFLSLGAGRHFSVPFDVVLVFATNMNPADLADEAFLRRIGYKIHFPYLQRDQYAAIWRNECRSRGVPFDPAIVDYAVAELHERNGVPLLPCHPRDLLGLALDWVAYTGEPREVTTETLSWAWKNYFANTRDSDSVAATLGDRS
jgi:hypothetical protein